MAAAIIPMSGGEGNRTEAERQVDKDAQLLRKEQKPKDGDNSRASFQDIAREFAGGTTVHGVSQIVTIAALPWRIFWWLVFLSASTALLYQATRLLQDYAGKPVSTLIKVDPNVESEFPAVTLCNLNMLRRNALNNTKYHPLYAWRTDYDPDLYPDVDFHAMEDFGLNGYLDPRFPIIAPSREEIERFGHQPQDFILECKYNGDNCTYRNFTMFQDPRYGNCFTFNVFSEDLDLADVLRTTKTGSMSGLHLTLFIEQEEYTAFFAQEAGVRVVIHAPEEVPSPSDNGLNIPPGQHTAIGLRISDISRLGWPYSSCEEEGKERWSFGPFTYRLYSPQLCREVCYQELLRDTCHCQTALYTLEHSIIDDDNEQDGDEGGDGDAAVPLCSVAHPNHLSCKREVDDRTDYLSNCQCDDLWPCSAIIYQKTLSTATWPSDVYEAFLFQRLSQLSEKAAATLLDVESTRRNLVRLTVFYEQLDAEEIMERPVYTLETLIGGLGGLMGVYVGISVISVAEIGVFLIDSIKYVISRYMRRPKPVPP